jgi:hypothetical protein
VLKEHQAIMGTDGWTFCWPLDPWIRFDRFDARLANDAYEKNCGMIFEYGHTVSHAIEKARLNQRGSNQDGVAMPR